MFESKYKCFKWYNESSDGFYYILFRSSCGSFKQLYTLQLIGNSPMHQIKQLLSIFYKLNNGEIFEVCFRRFAQLLNLMHQKIRDTEVFILLIQEFYNNMLLIFKQSYSEISICIKLINTLGLRISRRYKHWLSAPFRIAGTFVSMYAVSNIHMDTDALG